MVHGLHFRHALQPDHMAQHVHNLAISALPHAAGWTTTHAADRHAGGMQTIHTRLLMCQGDDSYPSSGRVVAVGMAGAVRG